MPATKTTLQNVVDYARTFGDITPVIGVGGFSTRPAIDIANDVMATMLSQSFPWKWNRATIQPFFTNSWQQDYASIAYMGGYGQGGYGEGGYGGSYVPIQFAWIEHAYATDFANTSSPKPIWPVETVRDIEATSWTFGRPGQICWLPNNQLIYGQWPGAGVTILDQFQRKSTNNVLTQIVDSNGNYLIVSVFGTTGSVAPLAAFGAAPGLSVVDGSVVWTVIDPYAPGFRLNPIPPQSGVVYQINPICQLGPPQFTALSQTLAPLPDAMVKYFRQGFISYCYRHSPEPQVRAKFQVEHQLWIQALVEEMRGGDRERDQTGFYPSYGAMNDTPYPDSPITNIYGIWGW